MSYIRRKISEIDGVNPDVCPDSSGEVAAARRYVSNADVAAAVRTKKGQSPGVEICERPVDIPILKQLGIPHKWIRTPNEEVGLGPDDGGVPGHQSSPDVPWVPTQQVDHAGEGDLPESECEPVPSVDQRCVEEELEAGQSTGKSWYQETCWDFVDDVIRKCTTPKESPP